MLKLADNLKLPPAIATQAISVLGIRGSGKTNTAGVLAEELLAIGQPVVVVDPTDAWWGLRSSADGKQEGFPILICGGPHGDLPLAEGDGKALAEFLVAEQVSAILSLRHLRKTGQRSFFVTLAEELYHLKGRPENRSALTLIIDEASSFVPQDVRGDVARSAGAVEDIVNRGRNVGFGVVLINQRAATLNKNVLTQCDTLIIHRMPSPQDRKAIRDWIEENSSDEQAADVLGSLAGLKTGEAWFWSPAVDVCQRVKVRLKDTFDSSRTPKIGEAPRQPKKLAEVNLEQLKGQMATSLEQARANDPKKLKARIAELEAVAKKAPAAKSDQAAIDRAVGAAVKQTEKKWLGLVRERNQKLGQAAKILRQIGGLCTSTDFSRFEGPTELPTFRGHNMATKPPPPKAPSLVKPKPVSRETAAATNGDGALTARQQRFLDAAATLATLGAEVTRETVAGWLGVHPRGGSVGEELKALADAGYIAYDRGRITITDDGAEAAGQVDPSEAIDRAKSGLTARQAKFFEQIVAAYPGEITREEIAAQFELHPRGGSLGEDLGRLVGRGLVEGSRGRYRARDFLFVGTSAGL